MVRKLIGGNKTGVSGIYEPDENTELTVAYEDLNNYTFDQDSPLNIRNLGNSAIGDLYINQDETQVYLTSLSSDSINQYNLSGTDVNPAYYHSKQFYVAFQDTNPQDIFFKDDGTVMYVVGDTAVAPLVANGEYVYQYTLLTAWDISTAVYSTAFRVTTQTSTVVNGLFIGDSGTKMYVCNNTVVYQYTLGTAWDVSTATYASKSYTVSGQDSLAVALSFKDDGTKMFVLGDGNNRVYQYTLGTAWDVSTASFVSSYLHGNEAIPTGLYIGSSGTKMYIIGASSTRQVHEYRMSVAWDISTAYYTRNYFDLLDPSFVPNNTESTPRGIGFKTDGTQIYLIGTNLDRVWQFPLTTAWDIRTVDVTPSHFIGDVENTPSGLYLSDDGRYAYTQGSNKITQFRMSTPWDITSIPYDTDIFSVSYQDISSQDIFFKDDGTEMYIVGQNAVAPLVVGSEYVHQYTLGTAWDITTASYTASFQVTTQTGSSPWGVFIGDSGTKMYVCNSTTVYQYTLGTAWDVSTATYSSNSYGVNSQDGNTRSVTFKPDGTKMYIAGANNDAMFQFTLGTAWDVSTASYDSKSYWFGYIGEFNPHGMNFKDDGTKVYISGLDRDGVLSFTLGTAWDISTATYDNQALGTFGYDASPNGVFLKSDGTRVYIIGDDRDDVVSLKLSTAWDLSSATVSSMLIPNNSGNGQSIVFKPDGTKLYTYDATNDLLQQYFLTSPWNVSTIYYDYKWRSLRFYDNSITALAFKNDGTRFYVVGLDRDRALTFPLETPWEVSPYFNNYSMRFIEGGSRDLYFKPDGTKVYVVGIRAVLPGLTFEGDYVHEFSLSTPWNLNTVGYTTSFYLETWITSNTSQGIFFKDDGTKMYIVKNNKAVYEFLLDTEWDISSITSSPSVADLSLLGGAPFLGSIYIRSDGTQLYLIGESPDRVYQFSLSTPWDINTISTPIYSFFDVPSSYENNWTGITFNPDGTKMYIVGYQFDRVYQYSLGTAWDITTASYDRKSLPLTYGQNFDNPYGLTFKDDGTKLYIVGDANHRIFEIPLETAWDIENASIDNQFNVPIGSSTYGFDFRTYSVSTVETDPHGVFFKNDGTTMYVVGQTAPAWSGLTANAEYVHQFSLATAWDVNTVGYTTSFQITAEAPTPTDMYIGAAGTALYVVGSTNDTIYQYTLGTAWDVSSASYGGISTSVASQLSTPTGLTFKPDGTKMYVSGSVSDTVFQYSLGTTWDISTASLETQFYIGNTNAASQAIDFSSDGTLMYTTGTNGVINEYQLSTAWDVSTAFFDFFNLGVDGGIRGLYFKPDGTSIYSANVSYDHIMQIDLKEPYKLFPPATKTLNTLIAGNLGVTGIELSSDLQRLYIVGNQRGLYKFDFNP